MEAKKAKKDKQVTKKRTTSSNKRKNLEKIEINHNNGRQLRSSIGKQQDDGKSELHVSTNDSAGSSSHYEDDRQSETTQISSEDDKHAKHQLKESKSRKHEDKSDDEKHRKNYRDREGRKRDQDYNRNKSKGSNRDRSDDADHRTHYRERNRHYDHPRSRERNDDRQRDVWKRESAWNRLDNNQRTSFHHYPKASLNNRFHNKNDYYNTRQLQAKDYRVPESESEISALKIKIRELEMAREIDQLKVQLMQKSNIPNVPFLETDPMAFEIMKLKEINKQYASQYLELKKKYDLKCLKVQKLQTMHCDYSYNKNPYPNIP